MDNNVHIAKILIFKIKQNYFAIDLKNIVKVTYKKPDDNENLHSLDNLPFFADIVANTNTTTTSSINKPETGYVIIKNVEMPSFITVDEIVDVINVNHYKLAPPSIYTDFKQYILSIYPFTNYYVSIININKLLKESLG